MNLESGISGKSRVIVFPHKPAYHQNTLPHLVSLGSIDGPEKTATSQENKMRQRSNYKSNQSSDEDLSKSTSLQQGLGIRCLQACKVAEHLHQVARIATAEHLITESLTYLWLQWAMRLEVVGHVNGQHL